MFALVFFALLTALVLAVVSWAIHAIDSLKPKPAIRRYSLEERHAAMAVTLPSKPIFHQFRWEGLSVQG